METFLDLAHLGLTLIQELELLLSTTIYVFIQTHLINLKLSLLLMHAQLDILVSQLLQQLQLAQLNLVLKQQILVQSYQN